MAKARKSVITDEKIDMWIKNNLNVMFHGKHGVGKTTMIIESWNRANLKWLYFSGATLDPWVDFIGIPQKVTDDTGNTYIELIRPKQIAMDEVEAIFIDEYNRSHKKIRNAVMELIQFKSINGKRLSNLKLIWAAVNPDEDDINVYDVEKTDPAQADRFHIHIDVPYEPSRAYFTKKFGTEIATQSLTWWKEQADTVKNEISPRRLDYAVEHFLRNGDLDDVLPEGAGISRLIGLLKNTPKVQKLKSIFTSKDKAAGKLFLSDEDNYGQTFQTIIGNRQLYEFFVPLMPKEKISQLVNDSAIIQQWSIQNADKHVEVKSVLEDIVAANTNKELARKITRVLNMTKQDVVDMAVAGGVVNPLARIHSNGQLNNPSLAATLQIINNSGLDATHDRKTNYELLLKHIPNSMTEQESLCVLDLLGKIAESSHKQTIDKHFDKFISVVNACMASLKNLGKMDRIPSFKDKYPKMNEYLMERSDFYFSAPQSNNNTATIVATPEPEKSEMPF